MITTTHVKPNSERQAPHPPKYGLTRAGWLVCFPAASVSGLAALLLATGHADTMLVTFLDPAHLHRSIGWAVAGLAGVAMVTSTVSRIRNSGQPRAGLFLCRNALLPVPGWARLWSAIAKSGQSGHAEDPAPGSLDAGAAAENSSPNIDTSLLRDLSALTRAEREMPEIPKGHDWAGLVKAPANTPEAAPGAASLGPALRDVEGTGVKADLAWPKVCPGEAPHHVSTARSEKGPVRLR